MNIENVDLYADVDEFGPEMDVHEMDLYDDMVTSRSTDGDHDPKLLSSTRNNQIGFANKHYPLIVSNLTWWTSDQDLIDALAGVGVTDLIEIKFHENRVNGQSKGFATIVFSSESSSRLVLEKLPRKEIHGQHVAVTNCNANNLRQLDAASKKEPVSNGVYDSQKTKLPVTTVAKPTAQQSLQVSTTTSQPIVAQIQYQVQPNPRMLVPPPSTPNTAVPPPNLNQGPITIQTHRPFIQGQTNVPPPMIQQVHMLPTQMHPQLQIINTRSAPPPNLGQIRQVVRMPVGQVEIRGPQNIRPQEQFNQPPPGHQFAQIRPSMQQVIVQQQPGGGPSIFTVPHGMVAVQHPMQQMPSMSVSGAPIQHIAQPLYAATSQAQIQQMKQIQRYPQNNDIRPGVVVQTDAYGRPIPSYVAPLADPYQQNKAKVTLAPPERPLQYTSPEKLRRKISHSRSPSYPSGNESYRDRRTSPPPIREIGGTSYRDRRDSPPPTKEMSRRDNASNSMQLSDIDFDDILQRNKTVSSSAISRAVQDARAGEYASAIETLVTAISLIKQSRIASDDRCRILISSLQDTLHGIESKSYGSKTSSSRISRERRSRSPRERNDKHILPSSSSSSRHRSRSREREYAERSRDKDRHYESVDRHRKKKKVPTATLR